MSLVYLKSEQYLQDVSGNILSESNELAHLFTNIFKEPIKINKDSKIELVSADLSITPEHIIGGNKENNCFTYCLGDNTTQQFLQKAIKIPDGTYTNQQLLGKINQGFDTTNLLDGFDMRTTFENGEYVIRADNDAGNVKSETTNQYIDIASKMGFDEGDAQQQSGVGTYDQTYQIINKNGLANPHTLLNSKNIHNITSTNLNNNTKPPNLISNIVVPKTYGVNNGDGYVYTIMPPLKFRKFVGSTFFLNSTGKTFEFTLGGVSQGSPSVLVAYTGSNGYNFMLPYGPTGMSLMYLKIVETSGFFNTLTLPNSTTTPNLPWGHFLIGNTTDTAVDTTLTNNDYVWILKTDEEEYYWELFHNTPGSATSIKCVSDTTYIKGQSVESSTPSPNWGSASLSISRGETAIFESNSGNSNQVVNTNKNSRVRVHNTSGSGNVDNVNNIYADYTIQITQDKTGTGTYALMNYGTQDASKVAGETDWLTLTQQTPSNDNKLSNLFKKRTLTGADNLVLIANVSQYYCVDFYVGHDTSGDLVFDDVVMLGTTQLDKVGTDAIHLPMNFNESSFPLMSCVGLPNGFLGLAEHQVLIGGEYSSKSVNTHSLSSLNNYMITNWGVNQTIPTRQKKQTLTGYCDIQNQEDLEVEIEPNGFLGKTTAGSVLIPDGSIQQLAPINEKLQILIRLGDLEGAEIEDYLTDYNYTEAPNVKSYLYKHLGMPKILYETEIDSIAVFKSIYAIQYSLGKNYIINLDNLGRIQGQNSATGSISQIVGVISNLELTQDNVYENHKHFKSQYPLPVKINATGDELINNFSVFITTDDGKPASNLTHPTNLLLKIS